MYIILIYIFLMYSKRVRYGTILVSSLALLVFIMQFVQLSKKDYNISEQKDLLRSLKDQSLSLYLGYSNTCTVKILILVAMHGNEQASIKAVDSLLKENWFILFSSLQRNRCQVQLNIMIGNPDAVDANARFIQYNMNRMIDEFKLLEFNQEYNKEINRAKEIINWMKWADITLDLHSCSSPAPPHALPASNQISENLALLLPVDFVLKDVSYATVEKGTTGMWGTINNKIVIAVECGEHNSIKTTENAKEIIKSLLYNSVEMNLNRFWIKDRLLTSINQPNYLLMDKSIPVRKGFHFIKEFDAFEFVEENSIIAKDDIVGDILMTESGGGYIVMPTKLPVLGEEAFFIATKMKS